GFPFLEDLPVLALWILVVFVSVLVHEMGHAVVGKALGGHPEIQLERLGGVTYPNLPTPPSALSQIGLSLAGPIAGLIPGAAGWAIERYATPGPGSALAIVAELATTAASGLCQSVKLRPAWSPAAVLSPRASSTPA